MINFDHELNSEQLDVIRGGDGPCLVLAGAGSGKTRTITYRVAYLLEQGVHPSQILLVTFTNKAAREMNERLQSLTGTKLPWSGTFHHIAYRLLKIHAVLLGYKNNFSVLDSDDSNAIIKTCVKNVKQVSKKFPSASVIHSILSYAKNTEMALEEVLELKYPSWLALAEDIQNVGREYEQKKKEGNAMDFDDLLYNAAVLLNQPDVRKKYAEQFKYILVDEYQDTNKLQASLINRFASVHKNLLVVGDDAQSIYSFRGADINNILEFEQDYPQAKIFKLETNYRSVAPILELANQVIANNTKQYQKQLRTIKNEGERPELRPHVDQGSEASFVVKKIEDLLDAGTSPREIAVLFRASHHSQRLELELSRSGILYEYRGGLRFFERAHIKDVLAYLRVIDNPVDTAAWLRILLREDGIGPAAADKLIVAIRQLDSFDNLEGLGASILGAKARVGWNNFMTIWSGLYRLPEKDPELMIEVILKSPYRDYLETEYIDSRDRLADIEELKSFAEKYDDLNTFLSETTLQESFSAATSTTVQATDPKDKIVLSTIHQAKGLEWEYVFIVNLARGAFPNDRSLQEEHGLEEERRLFYVAITRAKQKLFLTYPLASGSYGDFLAGPSMLLEEVNPELYDDHALLSVNSTVLNDPTSDIRYVDEDEEFKIKPGSFLRDLDDL